MTLSCNFYSSTFISCHLIYVFYKDNSKITSQKFSFQGDVSSNCLTPIATHFCLSNLKLKSSVSYNFINKITKSQFLTVKTFTSETL